MRKAIIKVAYFMFFATFFSSVSVGAQILKDSLAISLVKESVNYIYDFQFEEAKRITEKIGVLYPGHPIIYMLKGMKRYYQNYPLLVSTDMWNEYLNELNTCIRLCEKKHNSVDYPEYLLINLCARSMLLLLYTENDFNREVFPLAISTYPFVRNSFEFTSVFDDFFFFTGLYNYYREAYPEAYPVYKTLAFLFPKGNKDKGLTELYLASKNSFVMQAEAYSFLSWINIYYRKDFVKGVYYSKILHELYPSNYLYKAFHIKNLLLAKQYDEAESLIRNEMQDASNRYYKSQITILSGILQEKKYHNAVLAKQLYLKGADDISRFSSYGNEYMAYAYFGLHRVTEERDEGNKKDFFNKAKELADFKDITFND